MRFITYSFVYGGRGMRSGMGDSCLIIDNVCYTLSQFPEERYTINDFSDFKEILSLADLSYERF